MVRLQTTRVVLKFLLFKNQDWENPLQIESSKSQKVINAKLYNILVEINKACI